SRTETRPQKLIPQVFPPPSRRPAARRPPFLFLRRTTIGCLQAVTILFGALLTVAACLSLGGILLRGASRDPGLRFVSGAAALSGLVLALCALRFAWPAVFAGCAAAAIGLGRRWPPAAPRVSMPRLAAVAFAVFFVLYFFNAMAPE